MGEGLGFGETSAGRLSLILVLVVFLSWVFEKSLHWLEHFYESRGLEALKRSLDKVREELMLMGFVSLVLLAIEDQLLAICAEPSTQGGSCHVPGQATGGGAAAAHRRRLAASSGPTCEAGEESWVSAAAWHHTHILIFILAVVHVTATSLVLLGASRRVRALQAFEPAWGSALDIDALVPEKLPPTRCGQTLMAIRRHFFHSMDPWTWLTLRRLFVLKHNLAPMFDFWSMVLNMMRSDCEELMGLHWWLWVVAVVDVLLDGYVMSGLTAPLVLLGSIVVGAKLKDISLHLCQLSVSIQDEVETAALRLQGAGGATADPAFVSRVTAQVQPVKSSRLNKYVTANESKRLREEVVDGLAIETRRELRALQKLAARHLTDGLFWFGKPALLRVLLQWLLFHSSLDLSFVIFYAWQQPCYISRYPWWLHVGRVLISLGVLFHAGRITIPLYSLVLHMGDTYNPTHAISATVKDALVSRAVALVHARHGGGGGGAGGRVEEAADTVSEFFSALADDFGTSMGLGPLSPKARAEAVAAGGGRPPHGAEASNDGAGRAGDGWKAGAIDPGGAGAGEGGGAGRATWASTTPTARAAQLPPSGAEGEAPAGAGGPEGAAGSQTRVVPM